MREFGKQPVMVRWRKHWWRAVPWMAFGFLAVLILLPGSNA